MHFHDELQYRKKLYNINVIPLQMHLSLSWSMAQNHQHPSYASEGACILFPSSLNTLVSYFALPQKPLHQLTSFPKYCVCISHNQNY